MATRLGFQLHVAKLPIGKHASGVLLSLYATCYLGLDRDPLGAHTPQHARLTQSVNEAIHHEF